jgi:hypothetical protein
VITISIILINGGLQVVLGDEVFAPGDFDLGDGIAGLFIEVRNVLDKDLFFSVK